MTEAVSEAAAYAGASTGVSAEASAEAVAVSAAVLVGRSIGHLVRCRYIPCIFWYFFAYVCRLVCKVFFTDLNEKYVP